MDIYIPGTAFDIAQAVRTIKADYGVDVSVESKRKNLLKYGRNQNVGSAATGYTIWFTGQDQAHETYVFRNIIDSISSGSTSDVDIIITVEGHTVGDDLSVSSLTQSAGVATCTTSTDHGLADDDWVYIEGANETEYNGVVQVTVTGSTTFTYTVDSGATSPATGTITATDQNKTFVTQDVTLNGRTRVPLTTALRNVTRTYVKNQNRASDTAGELYVYENTSLTSGKPTDTTKIHLTQPSFANQSRKASTALSSTDFWIVTGLRGSILEKASSFADVALQVRELGGVFREREDVVAGQPPFQFKPFLIIPANADVRLVGISDSTSRDVSGSIQGYLASVV